MRGNFAGGACLPVFIAAAVGIVQGKVPGIILAAKRTPPLFIC